MKIKRALVSVSDKSGIVELCKKLDGLNISIISTGGTAKLLAENGLNVLEVSDHTGFPEMMDGRVKTLHPKIHGGLLGRRGVDDEVMQKHDIAPIDLLVVNLYPFEQTISKADCALADAIEKIDIGGPTMLRSAAKNHTSVAVVVDPADYDPLISELEKNNGKLSDKSRFRLARKAFSHTANYDANISNYLGAFDDDGKHNNYPSTYTMQFHKRAELRYGENPHQKAAFYVQPSPPPGTLANARQLQGKQLSYNNIADADAALECVLSFPEPACVIVKHANPCGVATGKTLLQCYLRAYESDPTSAFGGIIAFNRACDKETAQAIIDKQFVEVILAPKINAEVLEVTAAMKSVRIMEYGHRREKTEQLNLKRVSGGLLLQDNDQAVCTRDDLKVVTKRAPTEDQYKDLLFAWHVVKYVKSNAIVYCKDERTIGIGAGQMSRIYSARIATIKATDENLEISGAVMASDAFFPFRDGIDLAAKVGITAIIQPGGALRDKQVIAAADEHKIAMVFSNLRHFLH